VNIAQLRDIVTTLLTASPDLIGSYTLPNGQAIPAVYVVGQKGVPSEWKVSGLEVTMRQYAELLPKAGVGIVDILKQWEVVLVQYNPDSTQIADAMERMSRRFPDATFRYLPGDDVAYERCRIIIPDREVKTILR
jgi:hypothetical protein